MVLLPKLSVNARNGQGDADYHFILGSSWLRDHPEDQDTCGRQKRESFCHITLLE
jgi:hypothetical protein